MFRKSVSAVLIVLLMLGVLTAAPFTAEAKTSGDFEYTVSGGKAELTKYKGSDTEVVVPQKLGGYPVEIIGNNAFANNKMVESIVLPDTVTEISYCVCMSCNNLKSFVIPEGVTSMGWEVFAYCGSLTEITLPKSLAEIGGYCFNGCKSLTAINVADGGESFSSVDGNLYNYDKTKLIRYTPGKTAESFDIPYGVKVVGESAFDTCEHLNTVSIPSSVTTLEDEAFVYCSALSSVEIPCTVERLGFGVFMECGNLTDVTLPDNLESIGMYTFDDCVKLENIVLPANLKSIEECTFYGCENLKSVTIPDGVTSIGHDAFYFCKNLTDVDFSAGLTSIDEYAFGYCEGLKSVTFGSSLKKMGEGAFRWCKNLESVTAKGLTQIPEYAFSGCVKLKTIEFSESLSRIDEYTFLDCKGLEKLSLSDSLKLVGEGAFKNCKRLAEVSVEGVSTKIGNQAFKSAAKDLVISATLGSYAESYAKKNGVSFSGSDSPLSITKLKVNKLSSKPYTGKAVKQSVVIKNNHHTLIEGTDFTVTFKNNVKVGKATLKITGKGDYTGTITKTFKIAKADNPITVKLATKTVKLSAVKKKAQAVKPITVSKAQGKVSYKLTSIPATLKKLVKIDLKGVITISKWAKAKRGVCNLKVSITAKGNSNYNSKSVTKTVAVKVK